MKTSIRDPQLLSSVRLEDLTSYLRAKGWSERSSQYPNASTWLKDEEEVLVPKLPTLRDYPARVAEILTTLERMEARSQVAILREVVASSADIVRLRHDDTDVRPDGSIPLAVGANLIEHGRHMMAAVAAATVNRRRVLPSRRPEEASAYMLQLRLGQTEQGSYIVTLVSPVVPLLVPHDAGLLEFMEDPFPRRVTRTLATALIATKEAVQYASETGKLDAFEASVEKGASANLFDAIAGMAKSPERTHGLSISLSWAPSRPIESHFDGVTFDPPSIPIIEDAARVFREQSPIEGTLVVGTVVRLHRERTEPGEISVASIVEGKPRQLILRLSDEDYDVAIEAHKRRAAISFIADIVREGKSFRAQSVEQLRLVPDEAEEGPSKSPSD